MSNITKYLSLSIVLLAMGFNSSSANYDVDKAIRELDETLANRNQFYTIRLNQIDSIKTLLKNGGHSPRETMLNIERIGDEYAHFNNDSTLKYFTSGMRRAFEWEDDSLIKVFNLKMAAFFPMSGHVGYALRHYEYVDTTGMSDRLKMLYYESGRRMNYMMSVLNESNPAEYKQCIENIINCQRHMLELVDPDTILHDVYQGEYYFQTGEYRKAWDLLETSLERLDPDSRLYATTADMLSRIAYRQGDDVARKYYLAIAAKAEIRSFKREVSSLQALASLMFDEHDVRHAYDYMLVALENATECRSVARIMQISPQLPLITEANTQLREWWVRTYTIIISILGVCVLIIIIITYFLVRHIKRMRVMQRKLVDTNNLKNMYMSQFMVMSSIFMDKLNQFNAMVNRKIGAGQTDELYNLTKNGTYIQEQVNDFYKVFDESFLHIYPNFVEEVNKLLLPNEQIVLKEGEQLNNDLRMLACIKLGIDDASSIGQILGYSVNTIYAYRRKLRYRAINRDTFERDVMNIEG